MKMKILTWILLLFVLISSVNAAIRVIQDEDDEKTYTADSISYTITAIYIHDSKVKFKVDDETTDLLGYHDTYKFEDGSIIFVREILEEEVMEGPDKVIFNFYPAKCIDPECTFEVEKVEEIIEEEVEEEIEVEEEVEEEIEEVEEEVVIEEIEEEEIEEEVVEEVEEEIEIKKKGFLRRLFDWFVKFFIWWA